MIHEILLRNKIYKSIHKGERCFIVGNAPSINQLDLSLLQGEIVFSVSSGYHHPLYRDYAPRYHCVAPLTYTHIFTEQIAIDWFREMHASIGTAELFLAIQEYPLVLRHNLFSKRHVSYLVLCKDMNVSKIKIDLSDFVYGIQSVPIMTLQIALYMDFSKIYLIGCDHDTLRTGTYTYFYEPTVLKGKDSGVDAMNRTSFGNELDCTYRLFQQYRCIQHFANSVGCEIFNASPAGVLDVFERVHFSSLFSR
jgi:hypothetical protein